MQCPICNEWAQRSHSVFGKYKADYEFSYYSCDACHFSFVGNPWLEFDKIYSREYYKGKGADPQVDYLFELAHPRASIRLYEWAGLARIVSSLMAPNNETFRWLDFGCGNGGLVRFAREELNCDCCGFEEGYIAEVARGYGIPILRRDDLDQMENQFDIVTAIEVIEHVTNPLAFLRGIRSLLKPGGLLFLTTGNAQPWRTKIASWTYASVPEVHVSFFEPGTLALAMTKSGFNPVFRSHIPEFADVIKFKVLKTLGFRHRSAIFDLLPWRVIAKVVDMRYGVTKHPIGIAV